MTLQKVEEINNQIKKKFEELKKNTSKEIKKLVQIQSQFAIEELKKRKIELLKTYIDMYID